MLPSFLTRQVLRLRADGDAQAAGPREPALGAPTVWLARGLCRFERFRPPPGLSRRSALAAARVHARTRAPFARAGYALARAPDGFGVWWWDAEQTERLLADAGVEAPVRLRPEAAGQAVGLDGWRVVRGDGYEAQRWAGGSLEASAWRRTPFDAAAWSGFGRLAGGDEAAPTSPPAAQPVMAVPRSPYGARFVREVDAASSLRAATLALLVASLGASGFFLGQGLAAARRGAALRTEIAARESAAPRSRRPELAARARRLDVLAQVVDRPGPLARLVDAQRVLSRFGLRVTAFDAGRDELSVSVPASAAAGVDLLVEEMQARPEFTDVRPTLDRDTHTLTLRMRVAG